MAQAQKRYGAAATAGTRKLILMITLIIPIFPWAPGHTLDGVPDNDYGEYSNAKELENWVLHRPNLAWADSTGAPTSTYY